MIEYIHGNLFDAPCKILVNPVNTVGSMGKGIALEFRKRYPQMYMQYRELCRKHVIQTGGLYLWKKSDPWILLFPTKQHWRNSSRMEDIKRGLQRFAKNWEKLGADSVAFPKLGCGNGGLQWEEVRPLMEQYLKDIPMRILIYEG